MPIPEAVTAEVEGTQTKTATAATTETVEVKKPESVEKVESEKQPEKKEEVVFEADDIQKDGEGNLVFVVDDKTVYKGKDMKELLANFKKGVTEKESFIRTLKAEAKVKVPSKAEKDDSPLQLPDRDELYQQNLNTALKRMGIDPKMSSMTDAQWDEYSLEHGMKDWKIAELRADIRDAKKQASQVAEKKYFDESLVLANSEIIEDETQVVRQMLADSGVNPDDFDYEKILDEVTNEKVNRNEYGLLRKGRITGAAHKEIARLERASTSAQVRKEVEKEVAKPKSQAEKVPSQTSITKGFQEKPKKFTSYEEAARAAVKEAHGT